MSGVGGKPIPIILIVVGGVCIYAGIKKDNPLSVLKGVLTGGYTPPAAPVPVTGVDAGGVPVSQTGNNPYVPGGPASANQAYVPGGFKR